MSTSLQDGVNTSVADWGGGMSACCTSSPTVRCSLMWEMDGRIIFSC